jgi:hypothetical protein
MRFIYADSTWTISDTPPIRAGMSSASLVNAGSKRGCLASEVYDRSYKPSWALQRISGRISLRRREIFDAVGDR